MRAVLPASHPPRTRGLPGGASAGRTGRPAVGAPRHHRHAARGPRGRLRRRAGAHAAPGRAGAQAGLVFERAYAPAPLTLPSHATMLTGPAAARARRARQRLVRARPGAARRSRRRCARAGCAPPRSWAPSRSRAASASAAGSTTTTTASRRPAACTTSSPSAARRTWWRPRAPGSTENPGPCFVWVHLFDPHAPYDPPAAYRGADPYRGEIASADAALGELLRGVGRAGRGRRYVAVTSDHGEAFGEHGEESHSLFVYDVTLHVPLVLRGPDIPARREPRGGGARRPGRHAGRARARAPAPRCPGATSSRAAAPRARSTPRRWRRASSSAGATCAPGATGRYKLRARAAAGALRRRGGSGRDARPRRVRARSDVAAMTAALDAALARMGERTSGRAPDPEAAERLRALGYVQGPGGAGSGADPKDRVEVALAIARAAGPFPDAGGGRARLRGDRAPRPGQPARELPPGGRAAAGGPAARGRCRYFDKRRERRPAHGRPARRAGDGATRSLSRLDDAGARSSARSRSTRRRPGALQPGRDRAARTATRRGRAGRLRSGAARRRSRASAPPPACAELR